MSSRTIAGVATVGLLLLAGFPISATALWGVQNSDSTSITPPPAPAVSAEAWILYDDTFGQVLASHMPDQPRAIASTTKMMTALVVLEEVGLDEVASISLRADAVGESEIGLVAGEEEWTVKDLLAAVLLRSANDAAIALAEHTAGSVEDFAVLMNDRADQLGLTNTNFVNPHGLDQEGHFGSARDLLLIALEAMDNPVIARMVAAESGNLPPDPEGEPRTALNINQLLSTYPGSLGIKTGFTSQAGFSLAAAAERDNRRIFSVVLGSENHFADTSALLDYGFTEFGVMTLVETELDGFRPLGVALADVPLEIAPGFITEVVTPQPEDVFPEEQQDPPRQSAEGQPTPQATQPENTLQGDPSALGSVSNRATHTESTPGLLGLLASLVWVVRYMGVYRE